VDLVAIQQMLGHWTVGSTMRYVRPSATFIEDATGVGCQTPWRDFTRRTTMRISWKLRMTAAQHGVWTGTDLRRSAGVPYALLGTLLSGLGLFVATQYAVHGRSFDDSMQDDYGQRVLRWYLSGGRDQSFLQMAPWLHMPEHGSAYEVIVAAIQHLTGEQWHTRSVVGGIVGLLGVVVIALCGREIAGPWGALTSALGLALYPRYLGSIFNNSKDIPFAVAMTLVLWLVLRLVRRWGDGVRRLEVLHCVLLGAAIGFAAAIRVNGLAWFAILGIVAVGSVARQARLSGRSAVRAELVRQLGTLLIVVAGCYLMMALTWPYLILHPISGLFDTIRIMSAYDWDGSVLYGGQMLRATQLPWHYAPVWLVIGSPLPVVLLALAAPGVALWHVGRPARQRSETGSAGGGMGGAYLVLAAYVGVPLILILVLHPTLYNSLRQFLYVVPGLILVATGLLCAAVGAALRSGRRVLAWTLLALTVAGQGEAVAASARIYPYEYAYFSPIVGGYANARHSFEAEYWGSCAHAAAVWLHDHHDEYSVPGPTFQDTILWNSLVEQELPGLRPVGNGRPDFLLSRQPKPDYAEIHAIVVEGETLCRVSIKSRLSGGDAGK
jgi:hypothetical protein